MGRIIKLSQPVGSKVGTTGRTWTGPCGGEWVELDMWREKPGWLLVHGPGFDQRGPLLEKVLPGEEEPMVLSVMSPVLSDGVTQSTEDVHLCDICARPSQTLGEVKGLIVSQCPQLRPHKLQILSMERMAILCERARWEDSEDFSGENTSLLNVTAVENAVRLDKLGLSDCDLLTLT